MRGYLLGAAAVAVLVAVALFVTYGEPFAPEANPEAIANQIPEREVLPLGGDDSTAPEVGSGGIATGVARLEGEVSASEEDAGSGPTQPSLPDAEPIDPDPVVPEFDVVRVSPGGSAVIAGRAEPGATVSVLLGGEEQARAEADAAGNFVAFMDVGTADQPRVLSLSSKDNGYASIASEQTVIVAPETAVAESAAVDLAETEPADAVAEAAEDEPAAPAEDNQVAALDPDDESLAGREAENPEIAPLQEGGTRTISPASGEIDGDTRPETGTAELGKTGVAVEAKTGGGPSETVVAEASPENSISGISEEDSAPRVLLADPTGITVLQDGGIGPQVASNVSIDSIAYDATGDVVLGGRATEDTGFVRVYLDNSPVLTAEVAGGGQWRTELPEVDEGVYTLRVDQLSPEGDVISRTETPFKREPVEAIAALEADQTERDSIEEAISLVTVQPGFTLWGISRRAYGEGILYVRIFDANSDRIRDPDLIYPGQIFTIPE